MNPPLKTYSCVYFELVHLLVELLPHVTIVFTIKYSNDYDYFVQTPKGGPSSVGFGYAIITVWCTVISRVVIL